MGVVGCLVGTYLAIGTGKWLSISNIRDSSVLNGDTYLLVARSLS